MMISPRFKISAIIFGIIWKFRCKGPLQSDFKLTPLSDESDPLRSMRKNHNRKQAEEIFTLFSLLFVFDEREERWGVN